MIRAKVWPAILACLIVPIFVLAGEPQPFDATKFESLQTDGKPVVVVVHAIWCSVCKAQIPVQTELMRSPSLLSRFVATERLRGIGVLIWRGLCRSHERCSVAQTCASA